MDGYLFDETKTRQSERSIPIASSIVTILKEVNYWDAVRGDDLPSGVDWAAFDWAVNSGAGKPAKAIQRCVGTAVDGAIGPMTLKSALELSKPF